MTYKSKKNTVKKQVLIFEEDLIDFQRWGLDNKIYGMANIIKAWKKINDNKSIFYKDI